MTSVLTTPPLSSPALTPPTGAAPSETSTADAALLRRRELAAFLRSRRERLTPDQLGIPQIGRRRTPGLRREEVAAHAGVGVTWYTWLEQARDINVSDQVLDAISRTLLLDQHERAHLFTLAGSSVGAAEPESAPISDQLRKLLAKVAPYPAAITNGRYDLLAYNRSYTGLLGDLDALPYDKRNSLWMIYTSPTMRSYMAEPEAAARWLTARFRGAMADHVGEPAWKCMVRRLQEASPEFAQVWTRHDVAPPENMTKRFQHPELGALRFTVTTLWLSQRMDMRLVTYVPEDPETEAAVEGLMTVPLRPIEFDV